MKVIILHKIARMLYRYGILLLTLMILLVSCRTESITQTGDNQPDLEPNSTIINLIRQISLNDGSIDNVIDKSNCFTIVFPYSLTVNGVALDITSTDNYSDVEDILDESEDEGEIIISFPITILNADYTLNTITDQSAFDSVVGNCDAEAEEDDDIECVDFRYPITISVFNSANDSFRTININNDAEMFDFTEDFEEDDIANIQFPIEIELSDDSIESVANIDALETLIENVKNDCDEDDDDDYNDDDCSDCEIEEVAMNLINCEDWEITDFKYNGAHTDDFDDDFIFNFFDNDMLTVRDDEDTIIEGNWYVTVAGEITRIELDIPAFPRLSMVWDLDDLDQGSSKTKVKLEIDKDNHIKFENDECGEDDDDDDDNKK